MFKIDNDTRLLKHNVLQRVSELAYQGKLCDDTIQEIPFEQIPGRQPHFRCCVYKEREIIHQRVRLAMGKMPNGMSERTAAVCVIPAACEGCPIQRYTVTENCQKCVAKKCMHACPFGAISMSGRGAYIDPNKCRECGRCAAACPYSAIADLVRPCRKACPVGAIEIGDDKLADIDDDKCISCGACMKACPFGAISDRAQILNVINEFKAGCQVIAMFAPALEGEFGAGVPVAKLKKALEQLGFEKAYEVGLGADAVAMAEAEELLEHLKAGLKMTTSCCPAYYKAADLHIPEIKPFVSHTRTPMYYTAELLKQEQPECTAVFVGPCLAKRFEAENDPNVDYVLTFEEIGAMLVASGINVADCEPQEFAKISCAQGRRFPVSGGVAGAVASLVEGKAEFKPTAINGLNKASIKLLKQYATKGSDFNMIEVMCCEGGCVAGPGCVALAKKSAIMVENYVKTAPDLKDKQD